MFCSSNHVIMRLGIRACLISIIIASSRLRRSLDVVYFVKNALRAFFTKYTTSLARRSRARTQRERAKMLRIRHTLTTFLL